MDFWLIVVIFMFYLGGIVRDGLPDFKTLLNGLVGTKFEFIYHLSTQWARISGALVASLGMIHYGWIVVSYTFVIVLSSFYFDMKHGDGQGATDWKDEGYLLLSGVTSALPFIVYSIFIKDYTAMYVLIIAGLLKPIIWTVAWAVLRPLQNNLLWRPMRVAAGVFMGLLGLGMGL